eukprot:1186640-Amphidinium_carterae.1
MRRGTNLQKGQVTSAELENGLLREFILQDMTIATVSQGVDSLELNCDVYKVRIASPEPKDSP